ncbi:selenocysteine-specific translation elongation factor [Pasteurellaceae bacterium RH1A]|nr:selenocysteine-specific translation elongation factor [Pasteurellaceae bacterium RH1A]
MIFVTAGHVDHGKTALLQALTGTHTAHLPEEKKRGLTIDLGYAYLPLEDEVLGFIDVPGHQRFLSNMLAGLGGIEHALLVVSSEEGIKPQTVEHLTLLNLLKIKNIILVLTKADRVEAEAIQALLGQIQQQFPALQTAPSFVTSAHTGQGIEDLKAYLISLNQAQTTNQPFRYAIDRVFNIKGSGLVVTGTALAGRVAVGDEYYLSTGKKVRVKGIHAQNRPAQEGLRGQRLALNLASVNKAELERGDWITALPPQACDRITVELETHQALKENNAVHLYHFARHITGKLNLLTTQQAGQKGPVFAEILLDDALYMAVNDRLIIRSGDDSQTLAGARVLEIHSPKRHKRTEARLNYVDKLAQTADYTQRLPLYLADKALLLDDLCWAEQVFPQDLDNLGLNQRGDWRYQADFQAKVEARILDKLGQYHAEHNDQLGVTKARLYRMACLDLPQALAYGLIDELVASQKLAQTRGWIHLPDHRIELNAAELQIWTQIRPLFERTNQALWVRDVASELAVDEGQMRNLMYKIGKLGYLVPIVKDRFLLNEQIEAFAQLIKDFIEKEGEISVNQLRDQIQYGRKLTVQLIEYFDRIGFLRRKGNVHLLRDQGVF